MTAQTQTKRRVKVAVLGVGLMGKRHARNVSPSGSSSSNPMRDGRLDP
jgi:ketol-acid reductoisomerase